jgi:hypothetical protein
MGSPPGKDPYARGESWLQVRKAARLGDRRGSVVAVAGTQMTTSLMAAASAIVAAAEVALPVAVALAAPHPVSRGAGPVAAAAAGGGQGTHGGDLARQSARSPPVIMYGLARRPRRVDHLHPPRPSLVSSAHQRAPSGSVQPRNGAVTRSGAPKPPPWDERRSIRVSRYCTSDASVRRQLSASADEGVGADARVCYRKAQASAYRYGGAARRAAAWEPAPGWPSGVGDRARRRRGSESMFSRALPGAWRPQLPGTAIVTATSMSTVMSAGVVLIARVVGRVPGAGMDNSPVGSHWR